LCGVRCGAAWNAVKHPYLVCDPTPALARNFEVLIEEAGLALRGTFVINRRADQAGRNPRQRHRPRRGRVAAQGQGRALRGIASGEACPAKWTEGDAPLKPSLDLVGKV
jgi:peroxiredoxin (alkyl hydroperoxide reductase subunit C)